MFGSEDDVVQRSIFQTLRLKYRTSSKIFSTKACSQNQITKILLKKDFKISLRQPKVKENWHLKISQNFLRLIQGKIKIQPWGPFQNAIIYFLDSWYIDELEDSPNQFNFFQLNCPTFRQSKLHLMGRDYNEGL